jgi:hypothetical protein
MNISKELRMSKATKRFQKTRAETQKTQQFELAIAAHNKTLSDPATDSKEHQRATKRLKKVLAEKEAFDRDIAARRAAFPQQAQLEKVKRMFPEPSEPLTPEMRTQWLETFRDACAKLGPEPRFRTARAYLDGRIAAINQQIQTEEQAIEDAAKRATEIQNELDFRACEKARTTIADRMRPFLLKPRSLPWRERMQELLLKDAAKWREIADTRGDAVDETGARQSAIALAYAKALEFAAKRLAVFEYDIELQPSDTDLKNKLGWLLDLPVEENWVFRGKEEQARLRVALLRFRPLKGLDTDDIPHAPFPTRIPRSLNANPALLAGGELSKIPEQDRRAQIERKRLADLDKLRIEDNKAYQKLDKEILKPISAEDEIVAYYVECRTLDNPRLPDVLYWPDGGRAILGQDIHFDSMSRQFYVEDIAVEWLGPSQRQQISDEEAEIANQRSVAGWMQEWNQHIVHRDTPKISQRETTPHSTPFCRRVVKVLKADHMPSPSDNRHPRNGGQFRLGSFYLKEQCDAADQQMAKQGLRIFDGVSRPPEPVTIAVKSDTPTRDSNVWFLHEQKIKQETEDSE